MFGKCSIVASLTLALAACTASTMPTSLPELDEPLASPELATPTVDEGQEKDLVESPSLAPTPEPQIVEPAASIPDPAQYAWVLIAEGFSRPLLVTSAGDGSGRLFVLSQPGTIRLLVDGEVLPNPFLDIRNRVGSISWEQGLLGLAFHPNFTDNGYFYLNYTDLDGDTQISRFQISADPNLADPSSESPLLRVEQPYNNHNGGHIEFGPDGFLYIGMGDGGSAGDPNGNAQAPDRFLGSLLRIDVDSDTPYGIPADNPFTAGGGLPEVWAYGLRNPWRFSFDSLTNDLYIADVGQNIWEEIDFLPAGSPSGANFGWRYFEGNHAYKGTPPQDLDLVPPVWEYDHSAGRCSVTGGLVYRGERLPAWQGVYLFADFCTGEVFALTRDDAGQWQHQLVYDLPELITSFGADEEGEIYLLGRDGGLFALRQK